MIDLVGITCSSLRMELAKRFIKECKPAVIKGNGSEIRAIAGAAFHGTGVDVSAADAVTPRSGYRTFYGPYCQKAGRRDRRCDPCYR